MTGQLPPATPQSPECGVCWRNTEGGDDCWACYDCGLAFDPDTFEASFLDPDRPVCGAACDNTWHGDNRLRQGWGHRCGTCLLPAGHSSLHWTDCQLVNLARCDR